MNEQDQQTQPSGRAISTRAYGDTADELELMALDEARQVFGEDVRLEVKQTYAIGPITENLYDYPTARASGKKYASTIWIYACD